MKDLKIFDTYSKNLASFKPINPPFVGIYVCGPTVYGNPHLGHARGPIVFDVLHRFLKFCGYKVRFVRNITDVGHLVNDGDEGEDKIAKKARVEQLEPMEIVQRYTVDFHEVLNQFNFLPPSIEPTATGHIIEQIEIVVQHTQLIQNLLTRYVFRSVGMNHMKNHRNGINRSPGFNLLGFEQFIELIFCNFYRWVFFNNSLMVSI